MKRCAVLAAVLCVALYVSMALAEPSGSVRIVDFIKIQSMTQSGRYGIITIDPSAEASNDLALNAFSCSVQGQQPTMVFAQDTQDRIAELIPGGAYAMHETVGIRANEYQDFMGDTWVTMDFVTFYEGSTAVVVRTVLDGEAVETVLEAQTDAHGRVLATFPAELMMRIRDSETAVIAVISQGG